MYVKDDHRYTRGPGAIAAMDAVSPARRLAVARAQRELDDHEARTLGIERTPEDQGYTRPSRTRPPRKPVPLRPTTRPSALPPQGRIPRLPSLQVPVVKLPGSVLGPGKLPEPKATIDPSVSSTPAPASSTPAPASSTPAPASSTPAPAKVSTTIVASPMGPARMTAPVRVPEMLVTETVELPEEGAAPEPAPAAKQATKVPWLYLAAGVATWYLLTRRYSTTSHPRSARI